ncbi:MAG: peptidylprolyl isomerase [Clostridia bacterium]|nr:peptidylprolyl isomerase [Clostridia bacterium]
MADNNQNKAEQYRKERKERLAKAAKKNAKNIEKKTAARSIVKKIVAIVLVAAIGISCLGGILDYAGVLQSMAQVGYVKDEHISFAEYKYYFFKVYNEFFNQEYQYKYYGYSTGSNYDTSLAPDKQTSTTKDENGNEITWVEYFHNQAVAVAQMYLAYYQEAKAAGLKLDAAEEKEVKDAIADMREQADNAGKRNSEDTNKGYSLNAYLRNQYGNGVTTGFIKKQLMKEALVRKYYNTQLDTLKEGYSKEKVDEIFNKDKDSYLFTDLRMYQFSFETLTAEEGEKDKDLEKRQAESDKKVTADAKAMFEAVNDEKTFVNFAKKLNAKDTSYDADTQTMVKSAKKASDGSSSTALDSINEDLAKWAFKDSTKKNDKKLIEVKENDKVTGYIVALMANPKHDVDTVSVRHILFKTVDDNNQPLADEKIKEAKQKAEKALADWKSGDATEVTFAEAATDLTEDTGSQSTGGLYESILPGQMVPQFDSWCFDASRKAGDCEIVETTYGYHIIYFVSKDGSSKDNTIRKNLATEDFNAKSDEMLKGDEYVAGVGPRRTAYLEKDMLEKIAKMVANINAQAAQQSQMAAYQ